MSSNRFEQFLTTVKKQMKSKKGQQLVERELLSHLNQTKACSLRRGLTEDEAEAEAISRMGSPLQIGQKMNKLHRERIDWWIVAIVSALLVLSFAPFWFLDYQISLTAQLASVSLSLVVIFTLMFVDYNRWLKHWKWGVGFVVAYIIVVNFLPVLTTMINGRIYLSFFGVTISHHFLLLFLFLSVMGLLMQRNISKWKLIISSYLLLIIPTIALLFLPEMALAAQYVVLFALLTVISNQPIEIKSYILWGLNVCVLLFAFLFFTLVSAYRIERLLAFLNPEADPTGSGYVYLAMQKIISQSGWFGPKEEIASEFFMAGHTEFILVSLTYYGGWVLTILILALFSTMVIRLAFLFVKMKEDGARLILAGGLMLLIFPLLFNTLMSFGFAPFFGMNLPFISYGGSEKLFFAIVIGLMLSVYRKKDLQMIRQAEVK